MSYTYNLLLFLLRYNQKNYGYGFHVSCTVNIIFFKKNNFFAKFNVNFNDFFPIPVYEGILSDLLPDELVKKREGRRTEH